MPKFKVRVLADATVYKEVVVEFPKNFEPTQGAILEKALSTSELDGLPWLLPGGFQADQPYIGDPDNDVEPVDEATTEADKPVEFPPCPWPVPAGFKLLKVGDPVEVGYFSCTVDSPWSPGKGRLIGKPVNPLMVERPIIWLANPVEKLVRLERGPSLPKAKKGTGKPKRKGQPKRQPRKSVKKRT